MSDTSGFEHIIFDDFSGGMNDTSSVQSMQPNQLRLLQDGIIVNNTNITRRGAFTPVTYGTGEDIAPTFFSTTPFAMTRFAYGRNARCNLFLSSGGVTTKLRMKLTDEEPVEIFEISQVGRRGSFDSGFTQRKLSYGKSFLQEERRNTLNNAILVTFKGTGEESTDGFTCALKIQKGTPFTGSPSDTDYPKYMARKTVVSGGDNYYVELTAIASNDTTVGLGSGWTYKTGQTSVKPQIDGVYHSVKTVGSRTFLAGRGDRPQLVVYSEFGDSHRWPSYGTAGIVETGDSAYYYPENSFNVETPDSGRITGLKSANGSLYVIKETSFHVAKVPANINNWNIADRLLENGATSHEAITQYQNIIVYANRQGIYGYNGQGTPIEMSASIRNTYRNAVSSWFSDTAGRVSLFTVGDFILCDIRDDDDNYKGCFCFDFKTEAWSVFTNMELECAAVSPAATSTFACRFTGELINIGRCFRVLSGSDSVGSGPSFAFETARPTWGDTFRRKILQEVGVRYQLTADSGTPTLKVTTSGGFDWDSTYDDTLKRYNPNEQIDVRYSRPNDGPEDLAIGLRVEEDETSGTVQDIEISGIIMAVTMRDEYHGKGADE